MQNEKSHPHINIDDVSSVWEEGVSPPLRVFGTLCVFDKAHLSDWCGIPERPGKVSTSSIFRTSSSLSAVTIEKSCKVFKCNKDLTNSVICYKVEWLGTHFLKKIIIIDIIYFAGGHVDLSSI